MSAGKIKQIDPGCYQQEDLTATQCPLCDYVWISNSDFYRHVEESHDEELVAVCKTCNQLFSTDEVEVHLLRCKGTHICHQCRATFAQFTYLQRHMKRKHSQSLSERPKCDQCGRNFSSAQALLIHKRLHTGEMPYVCEFCEMRFNQPVHLQQHMESRHSGEEKPKPFKCEKCDRSFQQRSSFMHHRKQYHGTPENACQCRLCDKIFPYLSDLKRHLSVHLPKGTGMYACELCSKSFKQKRQLTAHYKVHLNPSLFTCPFCDKRYSSKSYLDHHVTSKHPSESQKRPRWSVDEEDFSSDDYLLEFGDDKSLLDIFWNSSPQISDANVKILKDCLFGETSARSTAPAESSKAVDSLLRMSDKSVADQSVFLEDFEEAMSFTGDEPPTISSRLHRSSEGSLEVDFLSESSR